MTTPLRPAFRRLFPRGFLPWSADETIPAVIPDVPRIFSLGEHVPPGPNLSIPVTVVDDEETVAEDLLDNRGVPLQIDAVEAHDAVADVQFRGGGRACVERLELQNVDIPLALERYGNYGEHERLIALVLDERECEGADHATWQRGDESTLGLCRRRG